MTYQEKLVNRYLEGESFYSGMYAEETECYCDDYNGFICNVCKKKDSKFAQKQWEKVEDLVEEKK